jgi:hypothetical protein
MISTHRIMPASHTRQWWLAGGIHPSQVVAAYQPKGAASLAASYINLANPGTNDAQVGVAPTLDSSGWVFNGSTQYLIGPVPTTHGFAIRYSGVTLQGRRIIGVVDGTFSFECVININGTYRTYRKSVDGTARSFAGAGTSGVIIFNNTKSYLNGVLDSNLYENGAPTLQIAIGCRNNFGVFESYIDAKVQAVVFLAAELSVAQIAALSAAMAAL